jgi:hypothetical protein
MKTHKAVDNAAGISPKAAGADAALFDERYRVVEVESQRLTIRGIRSGKVLTITNPNPEIPLSAEDYPVGKLIALSDPSRAAMD